jgi:hypothetical protein
MTSSSVDLTSAYQACMREATSQSRLMIERWSSALSDVLQHKASTAGSHTEKNLLRNAVVALKTHQYDLAKGLERELAQAVKLQGEPGADKKPKSGRSMSSISFDELELMDDNKVQQTLEIARLQQALAQTSEFELAGFSARLSTSQGFQKVEPDKNPLRPEAFGSALLEALRSSPIDTVSQSRLLEHGALLMGKELQGLYTKLDALLAKLGVASAPFGVITAATVSGLEGSGPDARGGFNRPAESALLAGQAGSPVSSEQLLTLDRLHRLMVGEYNDSFVQKQRPSPEMDVADLSRTDFSHTVPAAMYMLDELKRQGLKPQKAQRASPLRSVELIREHLKTEAKSLGQSVAIEVVGLMIEQLTSDHRLLAPVKLIIANSEPAFLRLALTDPKFFSDKTHPARRLLDVITTKSLAYANKDAPGFSTFMMDLHELAESLTEEHASDAQHFASLLQDFEQRQLSRSRQADEDRALGVKALMKAEKRNMLAKKIAAEMCQRSDFSVDDPVVSVFLLGPWSQVMAQEWLAKQADGTNTLGAGFSLALDDILRSVNIVKAPDASAHRQWLTHTVPKLLETLRSGLLTIDYPTVAAKKFFDHLFVIHRSAMTTSPSEVLGSSTPQVTDVSAAKSRTEALEKAFEAGDASGGQHWMAPDEVAQSGFMDFGASSANSGQVFASTQAQVRDPAEPIGQLNNAGLLAADVNATDSGAIPINAGDWVELLLDTRWLRAQLTFISPENTLFMFTSEGGRSHSMTSQMLNHLLKLNLVKIVTQRNVLDGALDNVAAKAMRNSLDSSFSL